MGRDFAWWLPDFVVVHAQYPAVGGSQSLEFLKEHGMRAGLLLALCQWVVPSAVLDLGRDWNSISGL